MGARIMETMINIALRMVWRLGVFALILVSTYLTIFELFPFLDRRFPVILVVILMYLVVSYGIIPGIIKIWRLVIKQNHIPRYVTTPDGWPADPINIAIVAHSKRQLIKAMKRAGWYTADKATFRNLFREAYAIIFAQPYPTAPFSDLKLFGRSFDVGFQIPYGLNDSPRHRHHVRFWELIEPPGIKHDHHYNFWLRRVRHLIGREKRLYIGAAIDDVGANGIRWRNLQITHKNDPDHLEERDLIVKSLEKQGLVKSSTMVHAGEPFKMRSQNIGTSFIVESELQVIELRSPFAARLRRPTP